MDNKKKVIIAAVLFIFLGLTVFTFANPDEEENNLDGGNNVTETDKNVETDNDDVDDNQNQENEENTNNVANINNDDNDDTTNNGTTNPEQPIEEDNSYENALNAVINAETLIDEDSYETAAELVELVTEETSKEELTNRLEEVKKGIDLKVLVSTLETKTNTAADKTDMDAARNYRVDEDIVNLVTTLTNETLKENLQSRLAVVAVLLDDTSLEIGIEDGTVFNTPTTIQIEDANEITLALTKEEETKNIENGTTLTDGVYTLRVVDTAFNTATVTFTVDTTAPVINLPGTEGLNKNELRVESGTEITYEDLLATVVDDNADATIAPYEAKLLISNVASENTYGITDFTNGLDTNYVGRYNIEYTVTDKAGHTTTATMLLVMTDTVAPVINLPGTAGLNKNELRVAAGTKITYEDLLATVVDATADKTVAPYEAKLLISDVASENTYGITDFTNGLSTNYVGRYNIEYTVTDKAGHTTTATMLLVMTDVKKPIVFGINKDRTYAKVNVTVKDDTAVTATIDGNPYELGTDYAVEGSHMLVVTDAAGNYTRVPFIIDSTPANVDENGNSILDKDIILVDQPFYNVIDNTMPITIDGNNKTVTQIITKAELFNWIGTRPTMANMFATTTDTGKLITIKNITFAGTTQSISLGRYYDSKSNVYNTMLDNVTIKGLNVVSYSGDQDRKIMFAPAVITFGTATIKNTTITGTKLSSYDDAYLYEEGYTDANGWTYQLTDLAAVNHSNTTIENSEVGKIWLWAKAKMTIVNSKVNEIPFTPNTLGGLIINGSTVNKITVTNFVSKPSLTVDNSTIEVLDVTQARSHKDITITNSTINKVLTAEGEMTLAQYQEWKQTH